MRKLRPRSNYELEVRLSHVQGGNIEAVTVGARTPRFSSTKLSLLCLDVSSSFPLSPEVI